jgi:hypothetical protein
VAKVAEIPSGKVQKNAEFLVAERERRYGEEVHGGNCLAMVPEECQPAFGGIWDSWNSPQPSSAQQRATMSGFFRRNFWRMLDSSYFKTTWEAVATKR